MNNPTEARSQYESAILQQLIKNAEDLAVVKFKQEENQAKIDKIPAIEDDIGEVKNEIVQLKSEITQLKSELTQLRNEINQAKGWLIAVFIGVIVNILSQPVLNWLN